MCGRIMVPQLEQATRLAASNASCARRRSRRAFDIFRFGWGGILTPSNEWQVNHNGWFVLSLFLKMEENSFFGCGRLGRPHPKIVFSRIFGLLVWLKRADYSMKSNTV